VGVILLRWLASAIMKVASVGSGFDSIASLEQFSITAATNGAVTVLGATLLLALSRETYRDVGFHRHRLFRQLGLGCLLGTGIFILDTFLIGPLAEALLPKTSSAGMDMGVLFGNIAHLPVLLAVVLLKGGFAEELWRTFTLTRFEKCFGKAGLLLALIASSIMFGLGHLYQGLDTAVANAIQGLLYALVYLRKRSAWEVVSAHAVFDLIAIGLGFLIYSG
jgi:membrane protease YdiL (CAAX protease family)